MSTLPKAGAVLELQSYRKFCTARLALRGHPRCFPDSLGPRLGFTVAPGLVLQGHPCWLSPLSL